MKSLLLQVSLILFLFIVYHDKHTIIVRVDFTFPVEHASAWAVDIIFGTARFYAHALCFREDTVSAHGTVILKMPCSDSIAKDMGIIGRHHFFFIKKLGKALNSRAAAHGKNTIRIF